ncbi:MAG: hypothetical protein R2873_27465 [Caldilineaceae bacterium]
MRRLDDDQRFLKQMRSYWRCICRRPRQITGVIRARKQGVVHLVAARL